MIIRSLKYHWPARKLEWLLSGFLMSWGVYVMFHPEIFTDPRTAQVFSGMAATTQALTPYPAVIWGMGAFLAGLLRSVALFINGAYTRTPVMRLIGSFVSLFILTQILIAMTRTGVPNTDMVTYAWLVIADLTCAYRAGIDAAFAERQRREEKDSRRAPDRSSRTLA